MAESRDKWEAHISSLKAEKNKREQGLDYKIPDTFGHNNKEIQQDEPKASSKAIEAENNPYVKKVSLDELIDVSRAMQNKPPVEKAKPTPFISREKEIHTPELGKK